MGRETRICQNCKSRFAIEPEDFVFYGKIGVPAPTWCPECRTKRRMCFMNERSFYKRKCDRCGKDVVSILSPKQKRVVYCAKCWWDDSWDAMNYGRDYDLSKPFFEQFKDLSLAVPEVNLQTMESTLSNSNYCNICSHLKDCYLLFNSDYNEDCAYGTYLERSKRCMDIYMGDLSELCYGSANIFKCNRLFSSRNCDECVEVWFSRDLRGCQNCFGCVGLHNKQYYIFNEPHTKEEYFSEIKKFNTGSYKEYQDIERRVEELYKRSPVRYREGIHNAPNVSGDYVFNSKNAWHMFECTDATDCKYCHFLFIASTEDSMDFTMWGGNAVRMYECMGAGGGAKNIKFSYETWCPDLMDVEYSWYILSASSNLFGCVGLRNKKYCILNKQYSKEDYERLVPEIKEHMDAMPYADKMGRSYHYGEFFPPEISPYGYNQTLAQAYFPMTEKEAVGMGFNWTEKAEKSYSITLKDEDIPDDIIRVDDSILQEIIECSHSGACDEQCTVAFKLIPSELAFYRQFHLPIPRLCPNCRYFGFLKTNNQMRLYRRGCLCAGAKSANGIYVNVATHTHNSSPCTNTFETSTPPDRPEIVYCEQCYQAEVA